jgi:hypothetical protein
MPAPARLLVRPRCDLALGQVSIANHGASAVEGLHVVKPSKQCRQFRLDRLLGNLPRALLKQGRWSASDLPAFVSCVPCFIAGGSRLAGCCSRQATFSAQASPQCNSNNSFAILEPLLVRAGTAGVAAIANEDDYESERIRHVQGPSPSFSNVESVNMAPLTAAVAASAFGRGFVSDFPSDVLYIYPLPRAIAHGLNSGSD